MYHSGQEDQMNTNLTVVKRDIRSRITAPNTKRYVIS